MKICEPECQQNQTKNKIFRTDKPNETIKKRLKIKRFFSFLVYPLCIRFIGLIVFPIFVLVLFYREARPSDGDEIHEAGLFVAGTGWLAIITE